MKNFKYILILSSLWLAACTQDNDYLPPMQEKGTVHLNLQSAVIDVDTRSVTPQDPLTDNPMYSLQLLHYNKEEQLIKEDIQYIDLGAARLTYQWSPKLTIGNEGERGTICLVANMDRIDPPSTLAALRKESVTLQFTSSGLIAEKKMYMFGYYEGNLTSGQSINIMMGRMAAALKFVISTPNEGNRYRITKIEIKNVAQSTGYFPDTPETNNTIYTGISETFDTGNILNTLGSGLKNELTYYYQVGENINPGTDRYTRVEITAEKGSNDYSYHWTYEAAKTYSVILGTDAPGTANRNYSLYRNNNYTFNIALN